MTASLPLHLPEPRQSRSLETQQLLIAAGRAILRDQPWETVSIGMIARQAGRSVGIFYQRFGSKDDFLTVLLKHWLDEAYAYLRAPIGGATALALVDRYLTDSFDRIRNNRYLWRAALQRAMDNPESWEPFRQLGAERRRWFADHLGERCGRPLDQAERHRLDLATQVFNSMINNALLNDPGPLRIDQNEFFPTIRNIFLTVAALDLG
jgi:AcrR family transcriptional regulator